MCHKSSSKRHSGQCATCLADLKFVETDDILSGVVRFGASNLQDPLAGFPARTEVELVNMELGHLFEQASAPEFMLVALNHMQVSVCTFTSRQDTRTGIPHFCKNILSRFHKGLQIFNNTCPSFQVYRSMML